MGSIEPGFNSDIVFAGRNFHVQTEDWGEENPFVVTRVFSSGVVILSLKTPYQELLSKSQTVGRQAVRLGMREQHQKVLDQLVSGSLSSQALR